MGNKRGSGNLKRDDSYIGMNRRKRRRNMMLAIPIVAAVVALVSVSLCLFISSTFKNNGIAYTSTA
jgi:hypothetical protein